MVFVSMSDKDAVDALFFVVQVASVGDNQVNAKHFLIGEHRTRINNHDVVPIFDDHHILSDLSQPSKGDQSNIFCCQGKKNLLTTSISVALLKFVSLSLLIYLHFCLRHTEVKAKSNKGARKGPYPSSTPPPPLQRY